MCYSVEESFSAEISLRTPPDGNVILRSIRNTIIYPQQHQVSVMEIHCSVCRDLVAPDGQSFYDIEIPSLECLHDSAQNGC